MNRGGRPPKPLSKKKRILRSAEQEFLLHGYDGTSIDAIVREVGGSKSTVYSHFPDKRVLFAEALRDVRRELDFSLPRFRDAGSASARETLELLAVELLTLLYDIRTAHLFRLVVAEAKRFPEVARQFYEEGFGEATAQIAAYLSTADRRGELSVDDPERAAARFFSLLRGDHYLRFLLELDPAPTPEELSALAQEAVEALLLMHR